MFAQQHQMHKDNSSKNVDIKVSAHDMFLE